MRIKKSNLVLTFFLLLYFPFSLRDATLISDGDNYVLHPYFFVDFDSLSYITSPFYWAIAKLIPWNSGENFVLFLSLAISFCIVYASKTLTTKRQIWFLLICIVSPFIFNTTQVALRNGLAVGVILLGLYASKPFLILIATAFHIGTFPVTFLLFTMSIWSKIGLRLRFAYFIACGIFAIIIKNILLELSNERGYTEFGIAAKLFTYLSFFLLSCLYWLSLKENKYRLFLPIIFCAWVFVGFFYEFGGRFFFQAMIISSYIVAKYAKPSIESRSYFLIFSLLSIYAAYQWHPLMEYTEGWFDHWKKIVYSIIIYD